MAVEIIKKFEGLELKAYKCPAGIWTIGYGHTASVTEGMIITIAQAEKLLKEDIQIYYNCVIRRTGNVCNNNQNAALTSFCYNVGIDAFVKSTLLKVIKENPNNFDAIKTEFMKWTHGSGKVLPGLVKRRGEEFMIYCKKSVE